MSECMPNSLPARRLRSGMIVRACIVGGLLLAGAAGLWAAQRMADVVLVKDPAPLSKPLPQLAEKFGSFVMMPPDRKLAPDIVSVLGTEDYLLRRYKDTRKNNGELGQYVSLNLNYYAQGAASPHVPEVCWAGNGSERIGGEDFIMVNGVPHMRGGPTDIRMHTIHFRAQTRDPSELLLPQSDNLAVNVAYCFQLLHGYVASPEEVSKHFWDPQARYAYHTKIELTITDERGEPVACEPALAEPIFADFLKAALPAIEECLPDPQILAAKASRPQAVASSQTQPASEPSVTR
jgi:hypothetical protein